MYIAIGDIHGQYELLDRLLNSVLAEMSATDKLIFLGDYLDRGPDSPKVIDRLIELKKDPRMVMLMGNHEDEAIKSLDEFQVKFGNGATYDSERDPARDWLNQGGLQTMISYGLPPLAIMGKGLAKWPTLIPEHHWEFLRALSFEYVTPNLYFVHAGLLPLGQESWEYGGDSLDPRLWIREPFLSFPDLFDGKRVIFGHTPQKSGKPLEMANKVGVDTAVAYGGPLTAGFFHEDGTTSHFLQSFEGVVTRLEVSTLVKRESGFLGKVKGLFGSR